MYDNERESTAFTVNSILFKLKKGSLWIPSLKASNQKSYLQNSEDKESCHPQNNLSVVTAYD